MSARTSPGVGRRSPAKARAVTSSEEDGNTSSGSSGDGSVGVGVGGGGSGSGSGNMQGRLLVGRKILKRLGDNSIMSGHVREYNSPMDGKEESWTLRYENPHADEGDEDNSDDDEEVNRAELDKLLNLQKVKEREFPQATPSKRGKGRPRKDAGKSTPKAKKSPSRSAAAASPRRSPGGGGGGGGRSGGSKKRPASPSSSSSASSTPVTPPPKKKKKKKGAADDSGKLRGNKADVGKRVAKEFSQGVFTGEVVGVQATGARGMLWKIDYEDGDMEDLSESEMNRYMQTYKLLQDKFADAKGQAITGEDLEREGLEEEDDGGELDLSQSQSQGTPKGKGKGRGKGKGKGKGLSAQEKQVGAGVRKFFDKYDEFYDGKVVKFFPPESDDEYGDMWLIKYEDGDAEHMEADELQDARAAYNERYALMRKRVALPTNTLFAGQPATNLSKKAAKITLYGETPVGARGIFSTIKGYRRFKSTHQSS